MTMTVFTRVAEGVLSVKQVPLGKAGIHTEQGGKEMTTKKTCQLCAYFNKADCGHVALNGSRDKGGNIININFGMEHNCPDYKPKK